MLLDLSALADLVADRLRPEFEGLRSPNQRLAYTIREAAEATGAAEHMIRLAITSGELHAKQAGEGRTGRYIIPAGALEAWLYGTPNITHSAPSGRGQRKAR